MHIAGSGVNIHKDSAPLSSKVLNLFSYKPALGKGKDHLLTVVKCGISKLKKSTRFLSISGFWHFIRIFEILI